MAIYTFIKRKDPENRFDCTDVKIRVESPSLNDVLEAFEEFLKACGFHQSGTLDFVEEGDDLNTKQGEEE
jgi:hypothetical protein